MSFNCKIVADSLAPCNKRLTTVVITYPRFIHSEILTHRDRARNSASSRAIPWPKMMVAISENPVIPIRWGSEQKGMQAGCEIPEKMQDLARVIWLAVRDKAIEAAEMLHNIGRTYCELAEQTEEAQRIQDFLGTDIALNDLSVTEEDRQVKIHKSIPNRVTEPWMWITVVMTATEWANFFRLRCHPDAEIHFQRIAGMIRNALERSKPIEVGYCGWHLPFIQPDEVSVDLEVRKKCSVARCARVSYLTHEGTRDIGKDLELFERLVTGSGFGHWSPHEHVAQALPIPERSGPFIGWRQYRKEFPQECAG